jgi:hypothetical protein
MGTRNPTKRSRVAKNSVSPYDSFDATLQCTARNAELKDDLV